MICHDRSVFPSMTCFVAGVLVGQHGRLGVRISDLSLILLPFCSSRKSRLQPCGTTCLWTGSISTFALSMALIIVQKEEWPALFLFLLGSDCMRLAHFGGILLCCRFLVLLGQLTYRRLQLFALFLCLGLDIVYDG